MADFEITPANGAYKGFTRLTVAGDRQVVCVGTGPDAEAAVLGKWEEAMLLARIEIQEGRDG
jgi:hypothetical protein